MYCCKKSGVGMHNGKNETLLGHLRSGSSQQGFLSWGGLTYLFGKSFTNYYYDDKRLSTERMEFTTYLLFLFFAFEWNPKDIKVTK